MRQEFNYLSHVSVEESYEFLIHFMYPVMLKYCWLTYIIRWIGIKIDIQTDTNNSAKKNDLLISLQPMIKFVYVLFCKGV